MALISVSLAPCARISAMVFANSRSVGAINSAHKRSNLSRSIAATHMQVHADKAPEGHEIRIEPSPPDMLDNKKTMLIPKHPLREPSRSAATAEFVQGD